MKLIILGIFGLCLITNSTFGQEQKVVRNSSAKPEEVKIIKKEIRKEVRIEENNGIKTLTIITDDDGVITKEIFEGIEAETKLAELTPQMKNLTVEQERVEERVEAEVDHDGNLKLVKVITSRDGEETIEIFEGEAAEKKLEKITVKVETNTEDQEKLTKKKKAKRVNEKVDN